MRIRFWGVRGTIPTPGPDTVRLGGNTACIDILTTDQQLIIIDAGSGIRRLGMTIEEECPEQIRGTILISHTHWDHIQGFPFFVPIIGPRGRHNRFTVLGQKCVGNQLEDILTGQKIEPYLPFAFRELTADIDFHEVVHGDNIQISPHTNIRVAELRHPDGCLGYRIENDDHVFTYCTDSSHADDRLTESVLDLAGGADLLVHDAQYSLSQRATYSNYGHSSWKEATEVANMAGVECPALFPYDPNATDDDMEQIRLQAQQLFPRSILSREGLVVNLPVSDDLIAVT
jgi:phosphoribosyl 1,2-cyclic phosphodiesterase